VKNTNFIKLHKMILHKRCINTPALLSPRWCSSKRCVPNIK